MATTTPNYSLRKPAATDNVNVALDISANMDLLDAHAHSGTYVLLTETVNTVAASGATQTIPEPSVATISRITLTANCMLTFPTAASGKSFTLVLVQDGTGSRTVTWPGTVKWPAATAPTLSTGTGKIDYLSFVCTDGTNWAGFTAGLDVR